MRLTANPLTFRSLVPSPATQGCVTRSTLGEPETRAVPGRCRAQSRSVALSHPQPSCAAQIQPASCLGWTDDPSHTPNPRQPPQSSPYPISKSGSSPGCEGLYRYRCEISGAIPRVTPFQPLPSSLPAWEPSWSAAPVPLTSHTAHLLLFSLTPGPARATVCLSLPTGSGTWAQQREKQATSQRGPLAYFPRHFSQEQKLSHEKVQAGSPAKA